MAPTLVASYYVQSAGTSTAAISTPSFTPSNGEVLIVKFETWDRTISMGSVTGGSQTYTSRVAFGGTGFRPWVGITTATVSGSPGSMTVSATPSASARYSMVVERWSGAQLAATPATGTNDASGGTPSGTLTTTAANSVVSWVSSDAQSIDPATRAYLNSATDEGVRDEHATVDGVGYYAYYVAASAGSTTFGLSAPGGQFYCIAGIEVKDAGGGGAPGFVQVPSRRRPPAPGRVRRARTAAPPPVAAPVPPAAEPHRVRLPVARNRGRIVTPVRAQVNPPFPIVEAVQPQRPRLVPVRRGRVFMPPWPQQAAAAAPLWIPAEHRPRLLLAPVRRDRGAPPPVPAALWLPTARRLRLKLPAIQPRRPFRLVFLLAPPPVAPPFVLPQPHHRVLTLPAVRRGRFFGPPLVGAVCTCTTPRPNTGTTAHAVLLTTRPNPGTTTHAVLLTARPNTGTTARPCTC